MSSCASCGHQLGVGRFCTNCGAPVDSSVPAPVTAPATPPADEDDWRTDTAERRMSAAGATDPRTPPAAVAPPPPPRYPLFADEVPGYTPYGPLTTAGAEPAASLAPAAAVATDEPEEPAAADYEPYTYDYDDERRSPVLWILAAALVLVLVAAGWWFLVRDDGAAKATDGGPSDPPTAQTGQTGPAEGTDVASRASAKAPDTAPPNEDVNGDQVSYDASNMLDGVADTAWRAPGDATGMKLTFTLRDPTELHQVGLVNGYAKTSTDGKGRTFDWYAGNRRIESVVWIFDDKSKVRQQLKEGRDVQLVDVPDVVTSKVVLRILKVSAPGKGTASRNFTAISEVSLVGDPQS